jgi:hypothetical protein
VADINIEMLNGMELNTINLNKMELQYEKKVFNNNL